MLKGTFVGTLPSSRILEIDRSCGIVYVVGRGRMECYLGTKDVVTLLYFPHKGESRER